MLAEEVALLTVRAAKEIGLLNFSTNAKFGATLVVLRAYQFYLLIGWVDSTPSVHSGLFLIEHRLMSVLTLGYQ